MVKKITIAIDAMGGDNSPTKTIEGIDLFVKKNTSKDDFKINIFGDETKIQKELLKYQISKNKSSLKFFSNNFGKFENHSDNPRIVKKLLNQI